MKVIRMLLKILDFPRIFPTLLVQEPHEEMNNKIWVQHFHQYDCFSSLVSTYFFLLPLSVKNRNDVTKENDWVKNNQFRPETTFDIESIFSDSFLWIRNQKELLNLLFITIKRFFARISSRNILSIKWYTWYLAMSLKTTYPEQKMYAFLVRDT